MKTKKFLTIFLAITIVTALFSFQIQSSAEEGKFENRHYTIPQTLTPPVIDGVMSENEWTNAYHYFINYDEGYHWYGTLLGGTVTEGIVQDKKDACEGWDIYIQWVAGGDEAEYGEGDGGLYFCVIGKDKTRFNAPEYGSPLNASVDVVQLAIDPLNTEHTADRFLFDFAPYSKGESGDIQDVSGPASCYEHIQFKSDVSAYFNVQKASVLTENDYTMEFFIPWFAMHLDYEIIERDPGTEFGLGFVLMDWVGASPYYIALDFGTGADLNTSLTWPDLYNKVTLGGVPADAEITFDTTIAQVGEEITATVNLPTTKKNIGKLDLEINYDPSALELISTTDEIIQSSNFKTAKEDNSITVKELQTEDRNILSFSATDTRENESNSDGTTILSAKFKVLKEIEEFPAFDISVSAEDKSGKALAIDVNKNIVSSILLGDVNKNGKIDVADAMKAFRHVAGKNLLDGDSFIAADINKNGSVDIQDATKIFMIVAGKGSL